MRYQLTSSATSILTLPQDLNLPFFAYGAFKPGELAFAQIREYLSSEPSPVFAEGHLKVRDGLPLFDPNGSGNVRGFLLNFSPETGKLAYEKICAFEPKNIYFWTELRFGRPLQMSSGLGCCSFSCSGWTSLRTP